MKNKTPKYYVTEKGKKAKAPYYEGALAAKLLRKHPEGLNRGKLIDAYNEVAFEGLHPRVYEEVYGNIPAKEGIEHGLKEGYITILTPKEQEKKERKRLRLVQQKMLSDAREFLEKHPKQRLVITRTGKLRSLRKPPRITPKTPRLRR